MAWAAVPAAGTLRPAGSAAPLAAAMADATSANWLNQPAGSPSSVLATGSAQASADDNSVLETMTLTAQPLRAAWRMRWANSGWSLRRFEPTISTRCNSDKEAMEVPSQRTDPAGANSALRRRWSMLSLPRPRISSPARYSSSTVLCGLANVPMLLAPWSALMSFRPLAMYSSAVCQSTDVHRSPCLIIGLVRRSLLLRAS